jgi:CRISPR-associated exonuclease Cas4
MVMGYVLLLVGAAIALWVLAARLRAGSGLPDGEVVYSDTGPGRDRNRPFFSERYRLSGKPDYLVREGGAITPVEVKSGRAPARPRDGHVLQLAAYCLLVEEQLGATVRRGIVRYDDREFVVPWDAALRRRLLVALEDMRAGAAADDVARSHEQPARCRGCSVREFCDDALA